MLTWKTGVGGAKSSKICDIAKSAFLTFIKALFSPGSMEMSSLTTATQALELDQSFSYFLFPIKEISESEATSSCSAAVMFCKVVPEITPFKTLFISSME